ncbi:MAG: LPD7 domain-containing protein [Azonexus sp.]
MLIRVGGGRGGFAEYMERGRKAGREEDRDDLDRRLVLRGDLDEFERIVESMETDGEKYLHITLAFGEDYIPDDVLRQIDAEFHQFLTAAFPNGGEEIYIYGEAHQPRIKQEINAQTGEIVKDRLAHIHYAVPKINLVTGTHENPIGIHQVNLHWLEAFQEYINEKYNLQSPKDNPRVSGGKGEVLEQHKGDEFPSLQPTKSVKEWAAGIAQKAASFDSFRQQLAEHGEVQVRNAGKANEYLWLKPAGAEKGINFRENHYRADYFKDAPGQRPVAGKAKQYRDVPERTTGYGLQAEGEQTQWQKRMADWNKYGAKEMRWAGSDDRQRRYKITKDMPADERLAILNGREAKFYKKHAARFEELENGYDQTDKIERGLRYGSRTGDLGDRLPDRNRGGDSFADGNSAASRALANRSQDRGGDGTGPVVGPLPDLLQPGHGHGRSESASALLPSDVSRHQDADSRVHGLRGRGNSNQAGDAGLNSLISKLKSTDIEQVSHEFEGESSEIGELTRSLIEDIRQKSAAPRMAEIKNGLDPQRLLAYLAESHLLNTRLYKVEGQQIVAGRRSLSVNDFLTKEMHLAWPQAEAILHQTWGQQQRQEPFKEPEQAQVTDRELWVQFKGWKGEQIAAAKAERKAIYDQQTAALRGIRAEAKAERQEINQNARRGREGYAERQHALSVSRMGQILAEQEIRAQAAQKRNSTFNKEISFREFLVERSNGGDLVALERLRRMAPEQVKEVEGNRTTGEQHQSFKQGDKAMEVMLPREALAKRGMTSSVDRSGNVSYYQGDKLLLIDQRHSVVSKVEDSATMQMQLEFATRKFGYENLKLNGTDTFVDSMIRMAADKHFSRLTFEDKTHQARLDQYRAEFTQQEKKSAQQHPAKQDTEAREQDQTKTPKQDPERAKEPTPKNTRSIN